MCPALNMHFIYKLQVTPGILYCLLFKKNHAVYKQEMNSMNKFTIYINRMLILPNPNVPCTWFLQFTLTHVYSYLYSFNHPIIDRPQVVLPQSLVCTGWFHSDMFWWLKNQQKQKYSGFSVLQNVVWLCVIHLVQDKITSHRLDYM